MQITSRAIAHIFFQIQPSMPTALEILTENRITGFPVYDNEWKLVGPVSDYYLLALESISGRSCTIHFCKVRASSFVKLLWLWKNKFLPVVHFCSIEQIDYILLLWTFENLSH
ncbi:uncharacterized protein LOC132168695 isoform X2 [Corylus avellana]|uniref:uncharacterized protein LOC132168695 isoform X2 n=1 Tax=Corylus avellana TaxID=13451 RepID=UPI00286BAC9B|nr:uncharacterized protein LOC132168695 isoform X2 [Corylus avellana]